MSMRIDGGRPEVPAPSGNRAESLTSGDVVSGRVVAGEGGRVEVRLTDGSTLHARVADGVRLETGSSVRLKIGEKVDGLPTAQVMDRTPPRTAAGTTALETEVGQTLRDLGEKLMPSLVDRAVQLAQTTGMKGGQAAFLAANSLDGDAIAARMLGRILDGQFGFASNWNALAGNMADAVSNLPETARNALMQTLSLSEGIGGMADGLVQEAIAQAGAPAAQGEGAPGAALLARNQVALGTALREALQTIAAQGATPQEAMRLLQATLGEVPGGKTLLAALFAQTQGNAGTTAAAPTAAGLQGTGAEGAAATAAGNPAGAGQVLSGQGVPVGTTTGTVEGGIAAQMATGQTQAGAGSAGTSGTASQTGLAGSLPKGADAEGQGAMAGGQAAAEAFPTGGALPQKAAEALQRMLERLNDVVRRAAAETAGSPEQTKVRVLAAFDRAVARPGADGAQGGRDLDVGRMTQTVKEQLEWSSGALARMDAETAAALRPMVQDAAGAMRLFDQITSYSTFVQVPVQLNGQSAQGELYVMKRKGSRGRVDPNDFTLFLALDTEHLGHVESLAHAQNRQVTLQFRVPDEETLALLRELKPSLYEGLEKKGYHLVDLKARMSDAEPITPLSAAREARGRMGLGEEGGFDIRL